jgi:beta-glucosidase
MVDTFDKLLLELVRAKVSAATLYSKGVDVAGDATDSIAQAVEVARQADVVMLVLGESGDMSGEAASRSSLDLPGQQEKLLETVAATGKTVVLVLMSGRPLASRGPRNTSPLSWRPGSPAPRAAMRSLTLFLAMSTRVADCRYRSPAPSARSPYTTVT